jgi:hypothetical protein
MEPEGLKSKCINGSYVLDFPTPRPLDARDPSSERWNFVGENIVR